MDSDLEFTYFEIQFRGDPVADLRDCNFLFFFFLGGGGVDLKFEIEGNPRLMGLICYYEEIMEDFMNSKNLER